MSCGTRVCSFAVGRTAVSRGWHLAVWECLAQASAACVLAPGGVSLYQDMEQSRVLRRQSRSSFFEPSTLGGAGRRLWLCGWAWSWG
mmetsp:Transcript_55232/g.147488  ORF Transcript_55232/g.147488 Transcript_55232/m.147488 type:complete len:87 (-) Transcript_55232:21-281(-)